MSDVIDKLRNGTYGKRLEMADSQIEYGLDNSLFNYNENTRGLSWQIPRLDQWTRSKDYLINSANWRANKIVSRGIDLNIRDEKKNIQNVEKLQSYLTEDLYNPFFIWLWQGYFHGGAGLLIITDKTNKEDMLKPLRASDIRKSKFYGLKPLTRLYNIQPCYEQQYIDGKAQDVYINKIGDDVGIYDATEMGRPSYYRVSLNADLYGDGSLDKGIIKQNTSYIVHRSHLLIYNSSPLSHIEERIEQFFGTSIGEKAYVEMRRYENLIDQVSMRLDRGNVPVLKASTLTKASLQGQQFQNEAAERIDGVELSIAYGGMVVLNEDEEFTFEESQFTQIPELITQYKKSLSGSLSAPMSILFAEHEANDEKMFYDTLETDSERHLRSAYRQLIPIIYRSMFGEQIGDFSFTFKSLDRMSEKEKAEVMKLAMEIISIAWKDGIINQGSYQKMMLSASHNISDMLNELDEAYIEHIKNEESNKEFITYNTKQEELAKALNRGGAYNTVASSEGGKREGGNQRATKKPTPEVPIQHDKSERAK